MRITIEEKQELENIYQTFLSNEKIQRMKEIPMHRGSSCYLHSFRVAKLAIKRALHHKKGNLKNILIASILHDYYLYDWRTDRDKKKGHATKHPGIAAKNAYEDFMIDEKIQAIIKTHMWPINIKDFPASKEARIVTLADKTIAFKEAMCSKRFKRKRKEKDYAYIANLFPQK